MGRGNRYYTKDKERCRQTEQRFLKKYFGRSAMSDDYKITSCDELSKDFEEIYESVAKLFHGSNNKIKKADDINVFLKDFEKAKNLK